MITELKNSYCDPSYLELAKNIQGYLQILKLDTHDFLFKFQPNKSITDELEILYYNKPVIKINLATQNSIWLKTKTEYWKYCFNTTDLNETATIVVVELVRYILNQTENK